MATRYWVGGAGTWSTTSTTNWSASSGGAAGASAPTSSDDVVFDANSDAGVAYTVTLSGNVPCQNITISGLDATLTLRSTGTNRMTCYGSLSFPSTNFVNSLGGGDLTFAATTTGKTITTGGTTFGGSIIFNGVGGEWTLQDSLTTTDTIEIDNGSLVTNNQTISCNGFYSEGTATRSITLGSSTVTITSSTNGLRFGSSGLTFTAGTSTINCPGLFSPSNQTFYNVNITGNASATVGSATFNNLTFENTSTTAARIITNSAGTYTVNGTLSINSSGTSVKQRIVFNSTTFTLAATPTIKYADFIGCTVNGTVSVPVTGTSIGDGGGNTSITATAAKTVYWNLGGTTQVWTANAWATSSGGTPSDGNFPLSQDTAIFDNTGSVPSTSISLPTTYLLPNVDASSRTSSLSFSGSGTITTYSNFLLGNTAGLTTSNFNLNFAGSRNTTVSGTFAPSSFELQISKNTGAKLSLAGNVTVTGLFSDVFLNSGEFDVATYTLLARNVERVGTTTSTFNFGTTGKVSTDYWEFPNLTNLTFSGTNKIVYFESNTSGSRTFDNGSSAGGSESTAVSLYVTAGTGTITTTSTSHIKDLILTGFSGPLASNSRNIYGNLTIPSTCTTNLGSSITTFAATSGTQTITTNGVSYNQSITINSPGATVLLADNLTMESSRTLTLTAGTLNCNNKNVSTGLFSSSNSNVRSLSMGSGTWTLSADAGSLWNAATSTNFTLTVGTSTIIISSPFTGGSITFAGGGLTYNNVTIGGTGLTQTITFSGSNTITTLASTKTTDFTLRFTAGTTTTFTNWNILGGDTYRVTLSSSTSSTHTLTKSGGGIIQVKNFTITNSIATPQTTWIALDTSGNIDQSGNKGWVFTFSHFLSFII